LTTRERLRKRVIHALRVDRPDWGAQFPRAAFLVRSLPVSGPPPIGGPPSSGPPPWPPASAVRTSALRSESCNPRDPFLAVAFARPPGAHARQRMLAWAAAVAVRLRELGLDGGPNGGVGDMGPARFVLARSAKGPATSRAAISLTLDEEHVEVAVELPPIAARAARARMADPVRALVLSTALEALPEQFAVGLGGEDERSPASCASADQIRALLDRAGREQRPLWLGWTIARDVAVTHAVLLDEQLEDAVVALGSVFTILAPPPAEWVASESDRGASARRDRRERPRADEVPSPPSLGRGRRQSERHDGAPPAPPGRGRHPGGKRLARDRDDSRSLRFDHGARSGKKMPSGGRAREPDREPEASSESDGTSTALPGRGQYLARTSQVSPGRGKRKPGAKTPESSRLRARVGRTASPTGDGTTSGTPRSAIEKGSHVRVLEGPFSGKVGIVQEVDGKGGARVMLGLLAVRVDVRDLARCAEGRNRPVLSTSHRKRVPVRS
jgi:hypothetical protein